MQLPKEWIVVFPWSQTNPSNFIHIDSTVTVHVVYLQGWKLPFFHTFSVEKEQTILSLLHLTNEVYSSSRSRHGVVHCLWWQLPFKEAGNEASEECTCPARNTAGKIFGVRCTDSTVGAAEIKCAFGVFILTRITETNCMCPIIWQNLSDQKKERCCIDINWALINIFVTKSNRTIYKETKLINVSKVIYCAFYLTKKNQKHKKCCRWGGKWIHGFQAVPLCLCCNPAWNWTRAVVSSQQVLRRGAKEDEY